MTFLSHLWAHSVCRTLRPPIQSLAKGQAGLLWNPSLRAALSYTSSQACQAEDERVYIMGEGDLANLFAHALATKPSPPPITLLWNKSTTVSEWNDSGKVIEIRREDVSDRRDSFDAEFLAPDGDPVLVGGQIGELVACTNLIRNLIICSKNECTPDNIFSIKHRLNEQSTILFTENSLSCIEQVSGQVFPGSKSRPNFVACVSSHHTSSRGKLFSTTHTKTGAVRLGVLPRELLADAQKDESDPTPPAELSPYLIQQILDTPILAGKEVSTAEIIQALLEKLVDEAMYYSLPSIFRREHTDEELVSPKISSLRQLLFDEALHVLRRLPELREDPGSAIRFVRDMETTNKSLRNGDLHAKIIARRGYMHMYILERGAKLCIKCKAIRKFVTLLRQNRIIKESKIENYFHIEHNHFLSKGVRKYIS